MFCIDPHCKKKLQKKKKKSVEGENKFKLVIFADVRSLSNKLSLWNNELTTILHILFLSSMCQVCQVCAEMVFSVNKQKYENICTKEECKR